MRITANNLVSCLTKRGVRCVHDTECGNANATEYMTVIMDCISIVTVNGFKWASAGRLLRN